MSCIIQSKHAASYIYILLINLIYLVHISKSSVGDRLEVYQRCLYRCSDNSCLTSSDLEQFRENQPWYLAFTFWDCWDECEYSCMWHVIEMLQVRGYPVPQFHGKWPFRRFFGIQEPASFLFSVFNGFAHFIMWQKYRRSVSKSSFFSIWDAQALLSVNAFIWSAVFHARDTPLTEKLDYYCAFSLVLYSLYCLIIRISAKNKTYIPLAIAVPFASYFIYHIYYLTFIKFDYGYNMKTNVIFGLMNSCGWILWCFKNRQKPFVWKCAISVIIVNALLLLELGDFPPWLYIIDAHALWHLGTIPVPFLWYSFLIEDFMHELKENNAKAK